MSAATRTIATVIIRADRPTELSFSDLYTWVIWQFPKNKEGGLCGAIRPPIASHSWLPALIKRLDKSIVVHGHLDQVFDTPAAAAEWLESTTT